MNPELQELKQEIDKAGLPVEISVKLNLILDRGIARGYLTADEDKDFDNIINTAIAEAELDAELFQQVAEAYDDAVHKATQQLKHVDDIAHIENSINSDTPTS